MYKHLTHEQRYGIYLGLQKRETLKTIAQSIGVSKSTVSRELRRNMTANGKYVWGKTHEWAEQRKQRSSKEAPTSLLWKSSNMGKRLYPSQ